MLQIVPVISSIYPCGMIATFLNNMRFAIRTFASLRMLSNSVGKLYTSDLFVTT